MIQGVFATRHKDEILHLVRYQEEQEKAEHPLHRIMDIAETRSSYRQPAFISLGGSVRRSITPTVASSTSTMRRRPISSESSWNRDD
jgi:hypothetical protein